MCRSRREVSNESLVTIIGFDTEENEPCKVCPLSVYKIPQVVRIRLTSFWQTFEGSFPAVAKPKIATKYQFATNPGHFEEIHQIFFCFYTPRVTPVGDPPPWPQLHGGKGGGGGYPGPTPVVGRCGGERGGGYPCPPPVVESPPWWKAPRGGKLC